MNTYIQKGATGIYVEFETLLDENYAVGTTWNDYANGKWVLLTAEQLAFKAENPTASVQEVFNMELTPVPEPEEPPYTPNYNGQMLMFARMTVNDTPMTDMQALSVKDLHPDWSEYINQPLKKDIRIQYEHKLFKVKQDISVVLEHQPPSIDTASLYEEINEQNAGTLVDPIPYNGNMALENGKYYSQLGVIYKCIRDTGSPVYHNLADLVGLYVETV